MSWRTVLCCCALAAIACSADANDFAMAPAISGANLVWGVKIDGSDTAQPNPPLLLIRGQTYTFHVTNLGGFHSFYIKTVSSTGAGNAYTGGGLSANGITMDTTAATPITFTVPKTAPDTLFYNCGVHASMAGAITIDGVFANSFD